MTYSGTSTIAQPKYPWVGLLTLANLILPLLAIAAGFYLYTERRNAPTCGPEGTIQGELALSNLGFTVVGDWTQLSRGACQELRESTRSGAQALADQVGLDSTWDADQFAGFRHTNGDLMIAYVSTSPRQQDYLEVQQQAALDRVEQTPELGYKLVSNVQKELNSVSCLELTATSTLVVNRNLICQGDSSYERWVNVSIVSNQDPIRSNVIDELFGSVRHLEVKE